MFDRQFFPPVRASAVDGSVAARPVSRLFEARLGQVAEPLVKPPGDLEFETEPAFEDPPARNGEGGSSDGPAPQGDAGDQAGVADPSEDTARSGCRGNECRRSRRLGRR
jgi:hypothetical protein